MILHRINIQSLGIFSKDWVGQCRFLRRTRRNIRKLLVAAGFRKESVYAFLGSKLFLACALPALYIAYVLFFKLREGTLAEVFTQPQTLLIVVVLAIVGFLLPSYWLHYKLKNRQRKIFHTLPDILDLITVCVESGLSMDAALIRSTETPQFAKDPLAPGNQDRYQGGQGG